MKKLYVLSIAVMLILISAGSLFADDFSMPEKKSFNDVPYLYYSIDDDNLVIELDYHSGWGYKLSRFRFPDRLVLDVAFKTGPPSDFKPVDGYPVFERVDLGGFFLLKDFRAVMDEQGLKVTLATTFPLEYEPFFDEKNGILKIKIPLVFSREEKRIIKRGIEYREIVLVNDDGPRKLHLLYIDSTGNQNIPKIITAKDYDKKFLDVKTAADFSGAVCAVNGGFYSGDGNHQGLIIRDGQLLSYPKFERPVFARTSDNKLHIGYLPFHGVLHGPGGLNIRFNTVDATPGKGEVALLTPGHPSRISSDLKGSKIVIKDYIVEQVTTEEVNEKKWRYILWSPKYRDDFKQFTEGQPVQLEFGLGLSNVEIVDAIGGGPMLVTGGKASVSQNHDFRDDVMLGRHPRTGIGITKDGLLMLAVLEGRNPFASIGGSLEEFAELMCDYGAVVAMNLDGGGSSAMAVDGSRVSYVPGGSKAVTNMIGIFENFEF